MLFCLNMVIIAILSIILQSSSIICLSFHILLYKMCVRHCNHYEFLILFFFDLFNPYPLHIFLFPALNTNGLDKFLKSIERDPSYVDLEVIRIQLSVFFNEYYIIPSSLIVFLQANPSVGKDQPPDLASLVPSNSLVLPDPLSTPASSKGRTENKVSVGNKSTTRTGTIMCKCDSFLISRMRVNLQNQFSLAVVAVLGSNPYVSEEREPNSFERSKVCYDCKQKIVY